MIKKDIPDPFKYNIYDSDIELKLKENIYKIKKIPFDSEVVRFKKIN